MNDEPTHPALGRLLRHQANADALELLGGDLTGPDATTLLLAAMSKRAAARTPADVLRAYQEDRFVRPAEIDAVGLAKIRLGALEAFGPMFSPVELAPSAPLGSHSVFAGVSQNNVVSTTRLNEVAADPTNQLALEAAVRRRRQLSDGGSQISDIRLCGVERVTRAQVFAGPRSFAHFLLLGSVVAGRARPEHGFEVAALVATVTNIVRFIEAATGLRSLVSLTSIRSPETIGRVAESFADLNIRCRLDPNRQAGRQYYRTVCFKVAVEDGDELLEVGDGGDVDWTAKLLSDKRERLVIGGVGLDRLCAVASHRD